MSRAYVLLSGGIDSATCLAIANEQYDGDVTAIGIAYGQRHSMEMLYARRIAADYSIPFVTYDLQKCMPQVGVADDSLEIPNVDYSQIDGPSPTNVPFRNGIFLSIITGHIMSDPKAEVIYYGAHADDAANWAYADCTPEFIGAMANAIHVGSYKQIRLCTPLMWMTKAEVIEYGHNKLKAFKKVPWEKTWSCYNDGDSHCGTCATCRSRRKGFIDAGVLDLTHYENTPEDLIVPTGVAVANQLHAEIAATNSKDPATPTPTPTPTLTARPPTPPDDVDLLQSAKILRAFQKFIQETSFYAHHGEYSAAELAYLDLGLAGETGESVDITKKIVRVAGFDNAEKFRDEMYNHIDKILDETGDVLWYLTNKLQFFGLNIEDVMLLNMYKLYARHKDSGNIDADYEWPLSTVEGFPASYGQDYRKKLKAYVREFLTTATTATTANTANIISPGGTE